MRMNRPADSFNWVLAMAGTIKRSADPGPLEARNYSRFLSCPPVGHGYQREPKLGRSHLRRASEQQILQQPHRHRVLQHRHVISCPGTGDGATVHNSPPGRTLLCNEQSDIRGKRDVRELCRGRWVERATGEDDLSSCARFRGHFLHCLWYKMAIS
jgi:hypothetical protein